MLNLFRQNTFTSGLLVVLIALLIRIPSFLHPKVNELVYDAFLSNILFDFIKKFSNPALLAQIIATILIAGQAVLVNFTVSRHNILYKDTFLPGLCFIILNSLFPEQDFLTSHLIANTFLVLVFLRLCNLYESPKPLLLVLDSGILLGTGILFNYSLLIFLPFILISVVVFTSFNLRYIIVSLIGILLPVYFVLIFFYTTDRLHEMVEIGKESVMQLQLKPIASGYLTFAPWVLLLPMLLAGTFGLQQNFFRNKVKTRRIIQTILVFGLIAAISLFTTNGGIIAALVFFSIPVSIVIGYFLINTKRFWLKELIVLCLIAFGVYLRLI